MKILLDRITDNDINFFKPLKNVQSKNSSKVNLSKEQLQCLQYFKDILVTLISMSFAPEMTSMFQQYLHLALKVFCGLLSDSEGFMQNIGSANAQYLIRIFIHLVE